MILLGAKGALAGQFPDTSKIYRDARSAEAEYERAGRRFAPISISSPRGGPCDEVVGRFCLSYDTGRDTLPTEPSEIGRARDQAIAKLRIAFDVNRARQQTAYALIRLLLEGRRPQQAVEVAEAFRDAARDVGTANMLLGLTLNAAADIPAAERAFEQWLATMDTALHRRTTDITQLLDHRERRRYRRLAGAERSKYEQKFWRYADALYLAPGNEIRTEHLARHAETGLLMAAPVVLGGTSWGSDLAELTVRYGSPRARTRVWPPGFNSVEQITEHYDPEQMIYAPPALDSALKTFAKPGRGWPLDTLRTITGHAPSTLRRMLPLEHQASVFFEDTMRVLRVYGVIPLDSVARQKSARVMLFALDDDLDIVGAAPGVAHFARDSMYVSAQVTLPRSTQFYSMEVLEPDTRLAARARFRLNEPPNITLVMSDVLIAEPLRAGDQPEPRHSLLLRLGSSVGIYAEVHPSSSRPRNLRVRLRVLDSRRRATATGVSWIEEIHREGAAPVAATIGLEKLRAGRYFLELSVTDQNGATGSSLREIVILPQ